jgi:hypothetical protein
MESLGFLVKGRTITSEKSLYQPRLRFIFIPSIVIAEALSIFDKN